MTMCTAQIQTGLAILTKSISVIYRKYQTQKKSQHALRYRFNNSPSLSQAYHSPDLLQQYQLMQTANLNDQAILILHFRPK